MLQADMYSLFLVKCAGRILRKPEIWSCEEGQIRVTPTGQPSVFDMIKVLGGQKNPHQVWLRLTESHPEVLPKCENLRFPGRGQSETPVAKDKEVLFSWRTWSTP